MTPHDCILDGSNSWTVLLNWAFFLSCTCTFLTSTANMLFALLLCYFEGRLRSAGLFLSSSSLFPSVSSPLSHPALNQALCNSRLFISARNIWQHFCHILGFFLLLFFKYMAWSVVSLFLFLALSRFFWSHLAKSDWKFTNRLICSWQCVCLKVLDCHPEAFGSLGSFNLFPGRIKCRSQTRGSER